MRTKEDIIREIRELDKKIADSQQNGVKKLESKLKAERDNLVWIIQANR